MADLDDIESKLSAIHYAVVGLEDVLRETNTLLQQMVKLLKNLLDETKRKKTPKSARAQTLGPFFCSSDVR